MKPCTCLIFHPTDPAQREQLERIAQSPNPAMAAIATEGLAHCETRSE